MVKSYGCVINDLTSGKTETVTVFSSITGTVVGVEENPSKHKTSVL